jgi:hypothetical protein
MAEIRVRCVLKESSDRMQQTSLISRQVEGFKRGQQLLCESSARKRFGLPWKCDREPSKVGANVNRKTVCKSAAPTCFLTSSSFFVEM